MVISPKRSDFPDPTGELKTLTGEELKIQAERLSAELRNFETRIDAGRRKYLSETEREIFSREIEIEFKSQYLARAISLTSEILARTGALTIPQPADNDIQGMMRASSIKHGRASLYFKRLIGIEPATDVSTFLDFLIENLPNSLVTSGSRRNPG